LESFRGVSLPKAALVCLILLVYLSVWLWTVNGAKAPEAEAWNRAAESIMAGPVFFEQGA